MILVFIFLLMFLCFCLSTIEERLPKHYYQYIVWGVIILMVIISGTRPGTYVSDYASYERYFYNYDSPLNQLTVEPTFLWFCEICYKLGGTLRWVIWIFAILSIPLKIYSISRMATPQIFFLAIPIYLANFFQLHDCEQMRVAAGISMIMYCYLLRSEGKKWLWIPLYLVAISFHHTAVALIIPILITPNRSFRLWERISLILLPILGVFFWIIKVNPITTLPIPYIEAKMSLYEIAISEGMHPDILIIHPIVLLRIVTLLFVIYYYDVIYQHLKILNLALICESIGLFCWFALSLVSVFAVRMSELFEVTEIILFASVFYTMKPAWVGRIYPCMFALYLFLYGCMVNQFGFL